MTKFLIRYLILGIAVSACGYKGPLYLPPNAKAQDAAPKNNPDYSTP